MNDKTLTLNLDLTNESKELLTRIQKNLQEIERLHTENNQLLKESLKKSLETKVV